MGCARACSARGCRRHNSHAASWARHPICGSRVKRQPQKRRGGSPATDPDRRHQAAPRDRRARASRSATRARATGGRPASAGAGGRADPPHRSRLSTRLRRSSGLSAAVSVVRSIASRTATAADVRRLWTVQRHHQRELAVGQAERAQHLVEATRRASAPRAAHAGRSNCRERTRWSGQGIAAAFDMPHLC